MRTRGAVDRALRARRVSMPCRVASRADGANATPARHRVQRDAKNFCVDPARRRPIACARRCARAQTGGTAAHAPVELRPQDPPGEAPRRRVPHAPGPRLRAEPGGGPAACARVPAAAGDGAEAQARRRARRRVAAPGARHRNGEEPHVGASLVGGAGRAPGGRRHQRGARERGAALRDERGSEPAARCAAARAGDRRARADGAPASGRVRAPARGGDQVHARLGGPRRSGADQGVVGEGRAGAATPPSASSTRGRWRRRGFRACTGCATPMRRPATWP